MRICAITTDDQSMIRGIDTILYSRTPVSSLEFFQDTPAIITYESDQKKVGLLTNSLNIVISTNFETTEKNIINILFTFTSFSQKSN